MPLLLISDLFTRTNYTFDEAIDTIMGDLGLRENTIITSGDCGTWLNRAQNILARDSKSFCVQLTIPTTSGTGEYVLPSDAGAQAIAISEVLYKNVPLYPMTPKELRRYNWQWRTAPAGTPWGFYQCAANAIGLYPAPSASGTSDLAVWASVLPPQVSAPEDFFYAPAGCEDALILYAEYRASLKDAYGEGRDRIQVLREEWEQARTHARQMVRAVRQKFPTCVGSDASLEREWPWWLRPYDVATPIP